MEAQNSTIELTNELLCEVNDILRQIDRARTEIFNNLVEDGLVKHEVFPVD